jgi:eukaryotic-like serine/threonine-protein kinase
MARDDQARAQREETPKETVQLVRDGEGSSASTPAPAAPAKRLSLVHEIRRRHLFRTSTAYVVGSFAALQGIDIFRQAFELPHVILTTAAVVAGIGFPFNVFLAWQAYDNDGDVWSTFARKLPRPTWILVSVLLMIAGGVVSWKVWGMKHPPPRAQTVLVADLENTTGEGVFDGTLEPALGLAMEGASFITTYRREAARKIANDLKLEGSNLEEKRARLVAQREGVGVVTAGSIQKSDGGYRVSIRALDAFTGKELVAATEEVKSKDAALSAATKLAAKVRAALGDATPEADQMKEAETFSSISLDAAHEYAEGMRVVEEGKNDDALRHFQEAVRLDPGMGRAWSGLAVVEQNRGRRAEADRYFQKAMAHLDRMSEREKLRSRSVYYLFQSDVDKAIEVLTPLVQKFPADNAGHANLGVAYQLKRDFPKALASGRKAIEIYPRKVAQRNNVGLFAMYAGDFDVAIQEQKKVLEINPRFQKGYVGLALAQYASGKRDDAVATWDRLAALDADGASDAVEGLADVAIYESRIADARALLEKGIDVDTREKRDEELARKLVMLGSLLNSSGQGSKAVALADRARKLTDTDHVQFQAGMVYLGAGDEKKVKSVADDLERRMGADPRMYALLLQGGLATRKKSHADAVAKFKAATQLVDAWPARYGLGRAYFEAGSYAQALEEFEKVVARKGEATDIFLDFVPTYRVQALAQYHLARTQEALKSPVAVESFKAFLAPKRGNDDPLVADAKKRAGVP